MTDPTKTTAVDDARNPHRYEPGFAIEQHRDELIERLGSAIKRIAELEAQLQEVKDAKAQMTAEFQQEALRLQVQLRQEREATTRKDARIQQLLNHCEIEAEEGRDSQAAFESAKAQVAQLQTTVGQLIKAVESADEDLYMDDRSLRERAQRTLRQVLEKVR